jgi:hypothetical protein
MERREKSHLSLNFRKILEMETVFIQNILAGEVKNDKYHRSI